jgi:hypothetical protein
MAGSADITPDVGSVAGLISYRTVDDSSDEVGTFTDGTRPSFDQASGLCDTAATDTMVALGVEDGELPEELVGEATWLATLRAAQLIGLSFYPEQSAATGSATATLAAAYLTGVQELQDRLHFTAFRLG